MAVVLTSLAELEMHRHNFPDAEEPCSQAAKIDEKALGDDHPEFAAVLHKLALIYGLEGRYPESARVHEQALQIREKLVGIDPATTARWQLDYAGVLRKLHRKKEADQIDAQAQETLSKSEEQRDLNYRIDVRD